MEGEQRLGRTIRGIEEQWISDGFFSAIGKLQDTFRRLRGKGKLGKKMWMKPYAR